MKSVAQQDTRALGGAASVLARQKRDHIELDHLLDRLAETSGTEQELVLLDVCGLVFPHAFAEETVLWPVIRRLVPDGPELTLGVEAEHQVVNELVTRLDSLEDGSLERQRVLAQVVQTLRQDVRDEEDELLPRLQAALTPTRLRQLGYAWELVRCVAPTRAHPVVSRRPPGNVLAALPLALLDRCCDRLDAHLLRSGGGGAPILRWLSSAFSGASRAVERLPGMGQGEHPATRLKRHSALGPGTAAVLTVLGAWALLRLARRPRARAERLVSRAVLNG